VPKYDDSNPFDIDLTNLHEECRRQARLTRVAIRAEAEARWELDKAKAQRDVVWARVFHQVRRNPEAHGFAKAPSEKDTEAYCTQDEEYQHWNAKVIDLQRDLDLHKADVTAHTDRRKMLEREVELLSIDYFADREPRPATEPARAYQTEADKKAARRPVKPRRGEDRDAD